MKFTAETAVFAKALGTVANVISPKPLVPILSTAWIEVQPTGLKLRGSNMEIEIETTCEAVADGTGTLCVDAVKLLGWIRGLKVGSQVEIETDEAALVARSGRARLKLLTLSAADYPKFANLDNPARFQIHSGDLSRLLFGAVAAAADDGKTVHDTLRGVRLFRDGALLKSEATDGLIMMRVERPLPSGAKDMPDEGIILPAATIKALRGAMPDDALVEIQATDRAVRFASSAGTLVSKLMQGPYQARIDHLIGSEFKSQVSFDVDAMKAAVGRVLIAQEADSKVSRMEFTADGSEIRLSARGGSVHTEGDDSIDCTLSGDGFKLIVNARNLVRQIEALECETVDFCFAGPEAPFLIRSSVGSAELTVSVGLRG